MTQLLEAVLTVIEFKNTRALQMRKLGGAGYKLGLVGRVLFNDGLTPDITIYYWHYSNVI